MGRVQTNDTQLSVAEETAGTIGTLPGSPTWFLLEANDITDLGAEITKAERNPISRNRQRRKGSTVDLDSQVGFETDMTMDTVARFAKGFLLAAEKGDPVRRPTAVTTTAFTVASGATLPQNTLIFARGFSNTANNGLKVVDTGATATSIPVTGGGMTAETPAATLGATVEVVGRRGASGDIQVNASGNLISTALDFTTLGLTVGQFIFIGGAATANQFAQAANRGFARIKAIAANLLTLDKRQNTFVTDNGSGKQIDLYFSRFVRNVAVGSADYLVTSYQFEVAWENLGASAGDDEFEYATGNLANELGLSMALGELSTMTLGFIGLDTEAPVVAASRKTNAANAINPAMTVPFNPTSDFARVRLRNYDETGTDPDFKSLNLTIGNNITPEKVLGRLGARYMNVGNLNVDMAATAVFTSSAVIAAIRNNTTMSFDVGLRNDDGGVVLDIPALTVEGGDRELPENESVNVSLNLMAFQDPTLGYSLGVSIFGHVPSITL